MRGTKGGFTKFGAASREHAIIEQIRLLPLENQENIIDAIDDSRHQAIWSVLVMGLLVGWAIGFIMGIFIYQANIANTIHAH